MSDKSRCLKNYVITFNYKKLHQKGEEKGTSIFFKAVHYYDETDPYRLTLRVNISMAIPRDYSWISTFPHRVLV